MRALSLPKESSTSCALTSCTGGSGSSQSAYDAVDSHIGNLMKRTTTVIVVAVTFLAGLAAGVLLSSANRRSQMEGIFQTQQILVKAPILAAEDIRRGDLDSALWRIELTIESYRLALTNGP